MQCYDGELAACPSYTKTTSKPSFKTSQVTWTWAHIFILWQTSWWVSQRGLCTQAENISKWCWAGCCATNRRQGRPLHSVWTWAMWGSLNKKQTETHSWIIEMYYLGIHTSISVYVRTSACVGVHQSAHNSVHMCGCPPSRPRTGCINRPPFLYLHPAMTHSEGQQTDGAIGRWEAVGHFVCMGVRVARGWHNSVPPPNSSSPF